MRPEVLAEIRTGSEENENGYDQDCTYARCTVCDHETMSWGTEDSSVRRCLGQLNTECPMGANNWYVPT